MALIESNSDPVTMNRLHLISFALTQETHKDAKKKVTLVCVKYGVNSQGEHVYAKNEMRINIPDFDTYLVTVLMKNGIILDPSEIVTKLSEAKTTLGAGNLLESMVGFENGIGLIYKDHGLFDYQTLA